MRCDPPSSTWRRRRTGQEPRMPARLTAGATRRIEAWLYPPGTELQLSAVITGACPGPAWSTSV